MVSPDGQAQCSMCSVMTASLTGDEVPPLVAQLGQLPEGQGEAAHDLVGPAGHVVLGRLDVGVLAVGCEAGRRRLEILPVEVGPEPLDQCPVLVDDPHAAPPGRVTVARRAVARTHGAFGR